MLLKACALYGVERKMFKKTLICVVVAVLSGCDDSNNTSTKINSAKVESSKSATAVYFPGGGVDFGIKPISDKSRTDEFGAYIGSITFAFDDSVEKLSKLTGSVMIAQGYSEKITKYDKCNLCIVYSKENSDIAFAYNPVEVGGINKGSQLLIWWKEVK